jgi:hypothetical protein
MNDKTAPEPEQVAKRGLVTDVVVPIAASVVGGVTTVGATVAAEKLLKRPNTDKKQ